MRSRDWFILTEAAKEFHALKKAETNIFILFRQLAQKLVILLRNLGRAFQILHNLKNYSQED
jgi:hypothetical protein